MDSQARTAARQNKAGDNGQGISQSQRLTAEGRERQGWPGDTGYSRHQERSAPRGLQVP